MEQKPARVRIIDAAHQLMLTIGLARATTKEIARAAGCSEAALYKHFASKEELFVTVLKERLPRLNPLLKRLVVSPGAGSGPSSRTSPRSPARPRSSTSRASRSPPRCTPSPGSRNATTRRCGSSAPAHTCPSGAWTPICAPNRPLGRVRADADTYAAASLLLGACAQRAFAYEAAAGGAPPQPLDEFAASLASTLMRGVGA